jgi:hypothetical protein
MDLRRDFRNAACCPLQPRIYSSVGGGLWACGAAAKLWKPGSRDGLGISPNQRGLASADPFRSHPFRSVAAGCMPMQAPLQNSRGNAYPAELTNAVAVKPSKL